MREESSSSTMEMVSHALKTGELIPEWGRRGVAVPLFIGLDLQRHWDLFFQLATAFATRLSSAYHIALGIPDLPAQPNRSVCSSKVPSSENPCGQEAKLVTSNVNLRWPHSLHMTTFYFGGGTWSSLSEEAQRAMHLEGTLWKLCITHLVYADNALLLAVVQVVSEGLPIDSHQHPHVTLLSRRPFEPGHSHEVMRHLTAKRLLRDPTIHDTWHDRIMLVPGVLIGGVPIDVFVQQLPMGLHFATHPADADLPQDSRLVEARLESFWSNRVL